MPDSFLGSSSNIGAAIRQHLSQQGIVQLRNVILSFISWLKDHTVVAVLSGALALIGLITGLLNALGLEQYRTPTLIGTAFLIGCVFCVWMQRPRGDLQFTQRARRIALVAIVPLIALGAFSVSRTIPKPTRQVAEVRQLLRSLASLRAAMKDDKDNRYTFYQNYQQRRAELGIGFWTNATAAMEIPVRFVADHNAVLAAIIGERVVPEALAAADFAWAGDGEREEHLRTLLSHFQRVDSLGQIVMRQQATSEAANFEYAKRLNEEISRYYEMVLYAPKTYLTERSLPSGGFAALQAAENGLTTWLSGEE